MIVRTLQSFEQLKSSLLKNELWAYDVETTGLNVRKDAIIGFALHNGQDGFYVPIKTFNGVALQDVELPYSYSEILEILKTKKLLTWNGAFDMPITKNNLGVYLLPALYADVMLMKHTCDEEFPFGLKEVGAKIFGLDAKNEQKQLQQAIKDAGGNSTEYYKAPTDMLATYAIQDTSLTFKLFRYYSEELQKQGLEDFYYSSEVMPLYKQVTIKMEQHGIALDMPLLLKTQKDIASDIETVHNEIQTAIKPYLEIFTFWFLNKD